MAKIDTLIKDIEEVLENHTEVVEECDHLKNFAVNTLQVLRNRMNTPERQGREWSASKPKLYASEVGEECGRKMVYKFNEQLCTPEPLQPHTLMKFMYGDLLEQVVVTLMLHTDHKVTHLQTRLELHSSSAVVSGRPDCVVDRVPIDIKTMSPFAFRLLKEGNTGSFGYAEQVSWYYHALLADGETLVPDKVGILGIDKVSGKMHLHLFKPISLDDLEDNITTLGGDIREHKATGKFPERLPDVPFGKSGNRSLDLKCRYCPYKWDCWADVNGGRGLAAYAYSYGPVWLTAVSRKPKDSVPKLTRKEVEKL